MKNVNTSSKNIGKKLDKGISNISNLIWKFNI